MLHMFIFYISWRNSIISSNFRHPDSLIYFFAIFFGIFFQKLVSFDVPDCDLNEYINIPIIKIFV